MLSKAIYVLLALQLFALLPSAAQNKQTPSPVPTPTPIEKGDKLFQQMKYPEAVAAYSKDTVSAEAQWKMSRAYVCYADIITKDREYYYIKAENAARRCIKINPQLSYGHSWLAASLGNLAIYQGSRTKVMLCNEIKGELDKAIAINPKDDIALSIFGSFYHVLGNISWFERNLATLFLGGIPEGGYEDSEKYFIKAIQVSPTTMRHWYEMGKMYRSWGKDDKAREVFLKAQKCPIKMASDKDRLQIIAEYLKG